MKYICYDDGVMCCIIIFVNHMPHVDMASKLKLEKKDILGAGFINMKKSSCYGESFGLNIKSRSIDTKILKMHLKI